MNSLAKDRDDISLEQKAGLLKALEDKLSVSLWNKNADILPTTSPGSDTVLCLRPMGLVSSFFSIHGMVQISSLACK